MEKAKFSDKSGPYFEALAEILKLDFGPEDYIHQNPLFNSAVNLARYLALYDLYKQTLGIVGHIAEIGVWKGASFLFFAKLAEIFEPHSYTLVHGFDWFEGMKPLDAKTDVAEGSYAGNYEALLRLIELQQLGHVAHIHKMDVSKELDAFFDDNPSLQFKIVFFDCQIYEVVKAALAHFWPRLNSGGILILNGFNHSTVPEETKAVREFLPDIPVRTIPWSRQPTGYIIKP